MCVNVHTMYMYTCTAMYASAAHYTDCTTLHHTIPHPHTPHTHTHHTHPPHTPPHTHTHTHTPTHLHTHTPHTVYMCIKAH